MALPQSASSQVKQLFPTLRKARKQNDIFTDFAEHFNKTRDQLLHELPGEVFH